MPANALIDVGRAQKDCREHMLATIDALRVDIEAGRVLGLAVAVALTGGYMRTTWSLPDYTSQTGCAVLGAVSRLMVELANAKDEE